MRRQIVSLAVVAAYLFATEGGSAADRLVPSEYPTIQAAIDDSNDGDTIMVSDGTYTGDGNRDIDFLGKAITLRSENGPENCIINCQGSSSNPHRGFTFHSGEGPNSVLAGDSHRSSVPRLLPAEPELCPTRVAVVRPAQSPTCWTV